MRGDPRCYVLDGVGGFRVGGIISRRATADADGEIWHFKRRGRAAKATDKTSLVAGVYVPIAVGRGGVLRWGERELALRAVGFEAGSWGRHPVRISLVDDAAIEPGLLLFVAFVVRGLAEYATQ